MGIGGWREWAAARRPAQRGCSSTYSHCDGKVERKEASMHALGDWVSLSGKGRKVRKELERITKNKPEKFGPGQSFVVGV